MWLRSFLQDFNFTPRVDDPVEMLCDNKAVVQFTKDLKFHRKTSTSRGVIFFLRKPIKTKEVVIKNMPINKMIVDPLTKPNS